MGKSKIVASFSFLFVFLCVGLMVGVVVGFSIVDGFSPSVDSVGVVSVGDPSVCRVDRGGVVDLSVFENVEISPHQNIYKEYNQYNYLEFDNI